MREKLPAARQARINTIIPLYMIKEGLITTFFTIIKNEPMSSALKTLAHVFPNPELRYSQALDYLTIEY